MMTSKNAHLKPSELADMLGISRRTLDRWHAHRVGPPRVAAGRTILYRKIAVEAWMKANETEPTKTFAGGEPY